MFIILTRKKLLLDNITTKKPPNISSKARLNERFSNENIFKNETKYKINKNLSFDSPIENSNALYDFSRRQYEFYKIGFGVFVIFNALQIRLDSYFAAFLSLVKFISLIICYFIIFRSEEILKKCENLHEFDTNFSYLRLLLELITSIEMCESIKNENFIISYDSIGLYIIYPIIFNIFLNTQFSKSLIFYATKLVLIMLSSNHSSSGYIVTFFSNLFSRSFLVLLTIFFFGIGLEYGVKRSMLELWALYDSFKRSFNVFKKSLFEDIPNPIFIISRKQYNLICYKNSAADKMYEKISKNIVKKPTIHNRRLSNPGLCWRSYGGRNVSYSISDLLDKNFEELFDEKLENCLLNKKKFFFFPLRSSEKDLALIKYKQCMKITFYEGDLDCFEWYRVTISPCIFKSQESVFLQFIKQDDFYREDFISNYLANLASEFNTLIENADKACERIVDADSLLEKFEKQKQIFSNINNTPGPGVGVTRNNLSYITPPTGTNSADQRSRGFHRGNSLLTNKPSSTGLLRDYPAIIHKICYPQYDYSIWFFFKYNTNLLYDLFLSMKVYNEITSKKYLKPSLRVINLTSLLNSFDNNFYTLARLKNVNIKSNIFSNNPHVGVDSEFILAYDYLRVVIFNTYNFFINNCNDTTTIRNFQVLLRIEKNPNFCEELLSAPTNQNNSIISASVGGTDNRSGHGNSAKNNYQANNQNLIHNLQNSIISKHKRNNPKYENDICFNFTFSIDASNVKYDFESLNDLLAKFSPKNKNVSSPFTPNNINNNHNFTSISQELNLIKTIDNGFYIVYLITNLIYDSQLTLSKEKNMQILSLKIYVSSNDLVKKLQNLGSLSIKTLTPKAFIDIREEISEGYYLKILRKVYKMEFEPILKKPSLLKERGEDEISFDNTYNINDETSISGTYDKSLKTESSNEESLYCESNDEADENDVTKCILTKLSRINIFKFKNIFYIIFHYFRMMKVYLLIINKHKLIFSIGIELKFKYSLKDDLQMARQLKLDKEFNNTDLCMIQS